MGHTAETKCLDCGYEFSENYGGGFFFHQVRCELCGKAKQIGFDELGDLHARYLKGLSGPYCMASSEHDKHVREHIDVEPITEEEYHKGINEITGKCRCGGKYTMKAEARCPKCRSTNLEESEDGMGICYD